MRSFDSGAPVIPAAAQPGAAPAPRRRPFGLYAILFLLSMQGLLGVAFVTVLGIGMLVSPADLWTAIAPFAWDALESVSVMLMVAVVVVGLWRYRLWAWYGMMLLLAYWMGTDAFAYFTNTPDYYSMLLNVAMVFYLNQREVKELFEVLPQQEGAKP